MSSCHVVTTLNSPTAVTCAARGPFLEPEKDNLIVCKGSTIEIYSIMLDGIKLCTQFNIYGTIRNLQVIQIPERTTCSLFILTVHQFYTAITYSSRTQSIVTEFSGQIKIPNARETDQPVVVTVDSDAETLLVSSFTGYLSVIPFGKLSHATKLTSKSKCDKDSRFCPQNIRTNKFDLISMAALNRDNSLSILVGELEDLKTITTYKYSDSEELKDLKRTPVTVEATSHALISVPKPLGGLLVIGEYIISYVDPQTLITRELSIDPVEVTAWEFINDGSNRSLLGDSEGYLYMFTIETSHNKVVNLSSSIVGQVSRASCIIDLGNMMFYIGSTHGDSCLIQLIKNNETLKHSLTILSTYSCLGPIVDFCLFDYNKQGKQTMACCSGVEKDASIRIVENGIGFSKQFTLDFPLVYSVWALRLDEQEDSLLVSTALDTVLLKPNGQEHQLEGYSSFSSLDTTQPTLAAAMFHGAIVQVTALSVRMMTNKADGSFYHEWKSPENNRISIAKIKESFCVLCCEGDMIVYLELTDNGFIQKSKKQVDDVSCLFISLKEENGTSCDYVAVGSYRASSNVEFLQLPDLTSVLEHKVTSSTAGPNDLLVITMEKVLYLMVLLGDGQMFSCGMEIQPDGIFLEPETEIMVGTYCTAMFPYQHSEGEQRIFVAGQRPTVITSVHQTLFVYSVNLTNVFSLTKFNDILALVTEGQILFGQNDVISKLHHTKYDLPGEMPLRIEYTPSIRALVVGSCTSIHEQNKNIVERIGKIRMLNAQTFQVLDTYDLYPNEVVESMKVARFSEYPEEYIFVGTSIENSENPDNNTGRILVFTTENSKCELLDVVEVPGIVYRMELVENTIIAAVDGKMYGLRKFQPDLLKGERIEFKYLLHNHVVALDMDTTKNMLLVGDLMQSMSAWKVKNDERSFELELAAVDNTPVWMTAVKFVNESVVIGADDRHNLFTMTKPDVQQSRGPAKLELEGGYHLGTLINRFREDVLRDVGSIQESTHKISKYESAFTFVTVNGSIGTVKTIEKESFMFFKQIQEKILDILPNNGNLDHSQWRKYRPKKMATNMDSNYLDGDILKLYSGLNSLEKTKVFENYKNVSALDLEKWIYHLVS